MCVNCCIKSSVLVVVLTPKIWIYKLQRKCTYNWMNKTFCHSSFQKKESPRKFTFFRSEISPKSILFPPSPFYSLKKGRTVEYEINVHSAILRQLMGLWTLNSVLFNKRTFHLIKESATLHWIQNVYEGAVQLLCNS